MLTRLPLQARQSPNAVVRLMRVNLIETKYMTASAAEFAHAQARRPWDRRWFRVRRASRAAAVESDMILTRDRRALSVCRALNVNVEMIGYPDAHDLQRSDDIN